MEIRVAKTAGFCFGVKRAVDLTYGLLNEGCKVATLGPLIHNPQAVEDMQKKGALVADAIADAFCFRLHGTLQCDSSRLGALPASTHRAFLRRSRRAARSTAGCCRRTARRPPE